MAATFEIEKDPVKRYQTAQQLADELNRFLNDEPILSQPLARTNFETTLWANSEYRHGYLGQADEVTSDPRRQRRAQLRAVVRRAQEDHSLDALLPLEEK